MAQVSIKVDFAQSFTAINPNKLDHASNIFEKCGQFKMVQLSDITRRESMLFIFERASYYLLTLELM